MFQIFHIIRNNFHQIQVSNNNAQSQENLQLNRFPGNQASKVIFSKKNDDNSRPRSSTHAICGAKESSFRGGSNHQLDYNKIQCRDPKNHFCVGGRKSSTFH